MRRYVFVLVSLMAPAAFFACGGGGSGGSGGQTATGTGGSTGGSSTTSSTTSTTSDTTSTTTSSSSATSTLPTNACTNAADMQVLQSQDVASIAASCGLKNLASPDKVPACIQDATKGDAGGAGLSAECTSCFAFAVGCAAKNCLSQCITDSKSDGCVCCRDKNCDPGFSACSGIPNEPPAVDGGCP